MSRSTYHVWRNNIEKEKRNKREKKKEGALKTW